jgi:pantothenate kinase type III
MQGIITLDLGNSNPHAGCFIKQENQWVLARVVPFLKLQDSLDELNLNSNNTQFVISEVKSYESELAQYIKQGYLITRIKDYWRGERFAGMPVQYSQSLGEDRLIQSYYAYKTSKLPTLIIDAGTFITIDLIGSEGFKGGYIIPGLNLYFSLFQSGQNLKHIKPGDSLQATIPNDTKSAITEGYLAFRLLIEQLKNKYSPSRIILTGGNALNWENFLSPTELSFETDPHYIHKAIHFWMTTQIELL